MQRGRYRAGCLYKPRAAASVAGERPVAVRISHGPSVEQITRRCPTPKTRILYRNKINTYPFAIFTLHDRRGGGGVLRLR